MKFKMDAVKSIRINRFKVIRIVGVVVLERMTWAKRDDGQIMA